MTSDEYSYVIRSSDPDAVCRNAHSVIRQLVGRQGISSLAEGERAIWVVEIFLATVMNGGYQSFFNGSYNEYVYDASHSLRMVGLEAYARALDFAVGHLFPDGLPLDKELYEKRIDQIYDDFEAAGIDSVYDDPFEVYEEPFWQLHFADSGIEPKAAMAAFIRNNPRLLISS